MAPANAYCVSVISRSTRSGRHLGQIGVGERVDADLRALRADLADQVRVAGHRRPDHEERAGHVVLREHREDLRRPRRIRAVVEGQRHRARRHGDALPSPVGQVDHRAARAHRGGHRGVVAVLPRSPCVDPDLRPHQSVQQQHAAEHRDDQSDQQPLRAYTTTTADGQRRCRGAAPAAASSRCAPGPRGRRGPVGRWAPASTRPSTTTAPVFGAVVTLPGASSAATLAAVADGRRRRRPAGAAAAAGASSGAGSGTSSAPCGRPVGVRPEHHHARRDARQVGQRPDRGARHAHPDHTEIGHTGQRDQPAEAGHHLAAPPRGVHEDGHDRCGDDRCGVDTRSHRRALVGGIAPHGNANC